MSRLSQVFPRTIPDRKQKPLLLLRVAVAVLGLCAVALVLASADSWSLLPDGVVTDSVPTSSLPIIRHGIAKAGTTDGGNEVFPTVAEATLRGTEEEAPTASVVIPKGRPPLSNEIPRVVHHSYKEDLSQLSESAWKDPLWFACYQSFKRVYPESAAGYRYIWAIDETYRNCIATHFPAFLRTYDEYSKNICRADAGRYCMLYAYGGVYADLDYEALTDFWPDLRPDKVSLVESPYKSNKETVQNSLMASPRGHVFWERVFEYMEEVYRDLVSRSNKKTRRSWRSVILLTGPVMLSNLLALEGRRWAPQVSVLRCSEFQRPTHTTKEASKCGDVFTQPKGQKGVHWSSMSWVFNRTTGDDLIQMQYKLHMLLGY